MSNAHSKPGRPGILRLVRILSLPIILFWLLLAVGFSVIAPPLEEVATEHAVSMTPQAAPAFQAMMRIGRVFKEFSSDSTAMVVLEGQDKLGDRAHDFYNQIVGKLRADPAHVQFVQDFWSDPLTAAGSQSVDGKAAYVQVFLVGNQGTTPSIESVAAVRQIVADTPAPPGVKAYVTGNTAVVSDTNTEGRKSLTTMALVSIGVIFAMLLIVYRSIVTAILCLVVVGVELFAAQGVTAVLGNANVIGLTPYATSMITMLSIAAATDYMIFFLGRYHEARSIGQERELAFYTAYHGVSHVILGSGLTIAGACLCLSATRLPYFQTMGLPCAIALLVIVFAALTLAPAVVVVGSKVGLFDPKRALSTRGWRRVGTAVVRWPKPIIVVTCAIAVIGFISLLTYVPQYNDQKYTPPDMPANVAMAAAERHFSQARMNPELLTVEADHDLRDPADMLVIDRIAKSVFHLRGIERVQTITRPLGAPIEHSSIPFQIAMQNSATLQTAKFTNDNTAQMLEQADELSKTIANMEHMYGILQQVTSTTHDLVGATKQIQADTNELRDHIADFDDFFRPIRNYFYWEPHCFDIPVCWSIRSVFDTLDGIDKVTDDFGPVINATERLDTLMPQMLADLPPTIASMKTMRDFMVSTHSTMAGIGPYAGIRRRLNPDGAILRRSQKRRLLLPAAGSLQEPRLRTRTEDVRFSRR
jgi:RND superfamily putative drug exporter